MQIIHTKYLTTSHLGLLGCPRSPDSSVVNSGNVLFGGEKGNGKSEREGRGGEREEVGCIFLSVTLPGVSSQGLRVRVQLLVSVLCKYVNLSRDLEKSLSPAHNQVK